MIGSFREARFATSASSRSDSSSLDVSLDETQSLHNPVPRFGFAALQNAQGVVSQGVFGSAVQTPAAASSNFISTMEYGIESTSAASSTVVTADDSEISGRKDLTHKLDPFFPRESMFLEDEPVLSTSVKKQLMTQISAITHQAKRNEMFNNELHVLQKLKKTMVYVKIEEKTSDCEDDSMKNLKAFHNTSNLMLESMFNHFDIEAFEKTLQNACEKLSENGFPKPGCFLKDGLPLNELNEAKFFHSLAKKLLSDPINPKLTANMVNYGLRICFAFAIGFVSNHNMLFVVDRYLTFMEIFPKITIDMNSSLDMLMKYGNNCFVSHLYTNVFDAPTQPLMTPVAGSSIDFKAKRAIKVQRRRSKTLKRSISAPVSAEKEKEEKEMKEEKEYKVATITSAHEEIVKQVSVESATPIMNLAGILSQIDRLSGPQGPPLTEIPFILGHQKRSAFYKEGESQDITVSPNVLQLHKRNGHMFAIHVKHTMGIMMDKIDLIVSLPGNSCNITVYHRVCHAMPDNASMQNPFDWNNIGVVQNHSILKDPIKMKYNSKHLFYVVATEGDGIDFNSTNGHCMTSSNDAFEIWSGWSSSSIPFRNFEGYSKFVGKMSYRTIDLVKSNKPKPHPECVDPFQILTSSSRIATKLINIVLNIDEKTSKEDQEASLISLSCVIRIVHRCFYQISLLSKPLEIPNEVKENLQQSLNIILSESFINTYLNTQFDMPSFYKELRSLSKLSLVSGIYVFCPTSFERLHFCLNSMIDAKFSSSNSVQYDINEYWSMYLSSLNTETDERMKNTLDIIANLGNLFLNESSTNDLIISNEFKAYKTIVELTTTAYLASIEHGDNDDEEKQSNISTIAKNKLEYIFVFLCKRVMVGFGIVLKNAFSKEKENKTELDSKDKKNITYPFGHNFESTSTKSSMFQPISFIRVTNSNMGCLCQKIFNCLYLASSPNRQELALSVFPALSNIVKQIVEIQSIVKTYGKFVQDAYATAGQLISCLLRGSPIEDIETHADQWIKSPLFDGGFATTFLEADGDNGFLPEIAQIVKENSSNPFFDICKANGEKKLSQFAYDIALKKDDGELLVNEMIAMAPRAMTLPKSIKILAAKAQCYIFATYLKHTLLLDTAASFIKSVKEGNVNEREKKILSEVWNKTLYIGKTLAVVRGQGGDVEQYFAQLKGFVEFLLSMSSSSLCDSEEFLNRRKGEIIAQAESKEEDDEKTDKSQGKWTKSLLMIKLLQHTISTIGRLKEIMQARQGIVENQDIAPDLLIYSQVSKFIQQPINEVIGGSSLFTSCLRVQRTRAYLRLVGFRFVKQFLNHSQAFEKSESNILAQYILKQLACSFSTFSPQIWPDPNSYPHPAPTHFLTGTEAIGREFTELISESYFDCIKTVMDIPHKNISNANLLLIMDCFNIEYRLSDMSHLSKVNLMEFLAPYVIFPGTPGTLMDDSSEDQKACKEMQMKGLIASNKPITFDVRIAAWALFRFVTYSVANNEIYGDIFKTMINQTLWNQIYYLSTAFDFSSTSTEASSGFWMCSVCTFQNNSSSTKCDYCEHSCIDSTSEWRSLDAKATQEINVVPITLPELKPFDSSGNSKSSYFDVTTGSSALHINSIVVQIGSSSGNVQVHCVTNRKSSYRQFLNDKTRWECVAKCDVLSGSKQTIIFSTPVQILPNTTCGFCLQHPDSVIKITNQSTKERSKIYTFEETENYFEVYSGSICPSAGPFTEEEEIKTYPNLRFSFQFSTENVAYDMNVKDWTIAASKAHIASVSSEWIEYTCRRIGFYGDLNSVKSRRSNIACREEVLISLNQFLWVLLRCCKNTCFRKVLATPKWLNLLLELLLNNNADFSVCPVTFVLAARICGFLLPMVNPSELNKKGEEIIVSLFSNIGKLSVEDDLLEDKKQSNDWKINKDDSNEKIMTDLYDLYSFRTKHARLEVRSEFSDLFRLLWLSSTGCYREWSQLANDCVLKHFEYIKNETRTNDETRHLIAVLDILGGNIEPFRHGGRVNYDDDLGSILHLHWLHEQPQQNTDDEEQKLQAKSGVLSSMEVMMDNGDFVIIDDFSKVTLKPVVSVPFYKLTNPLYFLNVISDFVLSSQDAVFNNRELIVHSQIHRMSMRILCLLLNRKMLAEKFSEQKDRTDRLIKFAMQKLYNVEGDDSFSSVGQWEDRMRVINYFSRDNAYSIEQEFHKKHHESGEAVVAVKKSSSKKSKKPRTMAWNTTTRLTNVTFEENDTCALFDGNTSHRSVVSTVGFANGQHEWTITILKTPCCAYAGIMSDNEELWSTSQDNFIDHNQCVGIANFSSDMRCENTIGTVITFRLDMDARILTYVVDKKDDRTFQIPGDINEVYPAVESDENGTYKIDWISSSWWNQDELDYPNLMYPFDAYLLPGLHNVSMKNTTDERSTIMLNGHMSINDSTAYIAVASDLPDIFPVGFVKYDNSGPDLTNPPASTKSIKNGIELLREAASLQTSSAVDSTGCIYTDAVDETRFVKQNHQTFLKVPHFPTTKKHFTPIVFSKEELQLPGQCGVFAPFPGIFENGNNSGFTVSISIRNIDMVANTWGNLVSVSDNKPTFDISTSYAGYELVCQKLSDTYEFKLRLHIVKDQVKHTLEHTFTAESGVDKDTFTTITAVTSFYPFSVEIYMNAKSIANSASLSVFDVFNDKKSDHFIESRQDLFSPTSTVTFCSEISAHLANAYIWRFPLKRSDIGILAAGGLAFIHQDQVDLEELKKTKFFLNFAESECKTLSEMTSSVKNDIVTYTLESFDNKDTTDTKVKALSLIDCRVVFIPDILENRNEFTLVLDFMMIKSPSSDERLQVLRFSEDEKCQEGFFMSNNKLILVLEDGDELVMAEMKPNSFNRLVISCNISSDYYFVSVNNKVVSYSQMFEQKPFYKQKSEKYLLALGPFMAVSLFAVKPECSSKELVSSLGSVFNVPQKRGEFFFIGLDRDPPTMNMQNVEYEWFQSAMKHCDDHPGKAIEWILLNKTTLEAESKATALKKTKMNAIVELKALGYSEKECQYAIEKVKLNNDTSGFLEYQSMKWLLIHGDELKQANLNSLEEMKIDYSLIHTPVVIEEKEEKKEKEEVETIESSSFYEEAVQRGGENRPLLRFPSMFSKTFLEQVEEFGQKQIKFVATRVATEEQLSLLYARQSLLILLQYCPNHNVFQGEFLLRFLRLIEYSLEDGLNALTIFLRQHIESECENAVDVLSAQPPKDSSLSYLDQPSTHVIFSVVSELTFQLLLLSNRGMQPSTNETNIMEGSTPNHNLVLYLLDLFFYITTTLPEQRNPTNAKKLYHLRVHLFNSHIINMMINSIGVTSGKIRLALLRIVGGIVIGNTQAEEQNRPQDIIALSASRFKALKDIMINLRQEGKTTPFFRSLVELNVSIGNAGTSVQEPELESEEKVICLQRSNSLLSPQEEKRLVTNTESQILPTVPYVGENIGIFNFLGTGGGFSKYVNPHTSKVVAVSTSKRLEEKLIPYIITPTSPPSDIIIEGTENNPSWFRVDLNKYEVSPYCYTLSHASKSSGEKLRSWVFEGMTRDENDEEIWTILARYKKNNAIKNCNQTYLFPIIADQKFYSAFRIRKTLKSSDNNGWDMSPGQFELFGELRFSQANCPVFEETGIDGKVQTVIAKDPYWFTECCEGQQSLKYFHPKRTKPMQLPPMLVSLSMRNYFAKQNMSQVDSLCIGRTCEMSSGNINNSAANVANYIPKHSITEREINPFWQIDLDNENKINNIQISGIFPEESNIHIMLSNKPFETNNLNDAKSIAHTCITWNSSIENKSFIVEKVHKIHSIEHAIESSCRYIRIQIENESCILELCKVIMSSENYNLPHTEASSKIPVSIVSSLFSGFSNHVMRDVVFIANECDSRNNSPFEIKDNTRSSHPSLHHINDDCVHLIYIFIEQLNEMMKSILPFIDLKLSRNRSSLTDGFKDNRKLILWKTKESIWTKSLAANIAALSRPTIELELLKAKAFSEHNEVDDKGTESVFGQWYQQLRNHDPAIFRIEFPARAWRANYTGLRSIDAGGPYRDSIERMCVELESKLLPLFIPSPNNRLSIGENRDRFVPNPAATQKHHLGMYEMIGRLLGLSLRTKHLLNLHFPSILWKILVSDIVTMDDVMGVDILSFQITEKIAEFETKKFDPNIFNSQMNDIKFFVTGSDGKERELKENGREISLTWENKEEYVHLLSSFRCKEFDLQCNAIKHGLSQVVDVYVLSMFSWKELETQVCGRGMSVADCDLLESMTTYQGPMHDKHKPHIKWFWSILREDFTEEQRASFLTFVWGRSRLPLTAAAFETKFAINQMSCTNPDGHFPMAHTCFFSVDMPVYSSREIMYQKISWAIANCGSIDAD